MNSLTVEEQVSICFLYDYLKSNFVNITKCCWFKEQCAAKRNLTVLERVKCYFVCAPSATGYPTC